MWSLPQTLRLTGRQNETAREREQEEAREKSLVKGKESKMNIYQHKRKINDQ